MRGPPCSTEQGRELDQGDDVGSGAENEEGMDGGSPGEDCDREEDDKAGWRVYGVRSRGIAKGCLRSSGGVPGGEEERRIVRILVVEPETSGHIGCGEIIKVIRLRTQGAANEKDG